MQAKSWHLILACDVGSHAMPIRRQMGKIQYGTVCVHERAGARVCMHDVYSAAVPSMLQSSYLSVGWGSHIQHLRASQNQKLNESFAVFFDAFV